MNLCFRSDEPTGGLGHTASRMLVTQLLVLGDLFVRLFTRVTLSRYFNDSRKNHRRIRGGVPIGA